ncbi:MAG: M24 family metallopeptidase [Promethearchaeota archaeon]
MSNFSNSIISKNEVIAIIREKHQQIEAIMREENIDCWMIVVRETASNPDPIQNLIIGGELVWVSAFIFSFMQGKFQKTAIVGNFDALAQKNKGIWDEIIDYKQGISSKLLLFMEKLNPRTIALNYSENDVVADGLSHGLYWLLVKILSKFTDRFQSAEKIIRKLKGRKTATELKLITKACEITDEINRQVTKQLKVGMTETEIYDLFQQHMQEFGVSHAWLAEHCPMVDAGPDKEIGHSGPLPTQKTRSGHTLHNDFGVRYHGYCSDYQRMWFFGSFNQIPDELVHAFKTTRDAIQKAADFIHPGVRGYEVDQVAREYVVSQGYEEFGHALGHQVGIAAHDGGTLLGPLWERYGDSPRGVIEVDNVFTLELHVKTSQYGIVSLEEMIRIIPTGCEFIMPPQKSWWYISK